MTTTPAEACSLQIVNKADVPRRRFPDWLKKGPSSGAKYASVNACIAGSGLHTVCAEARCPNRAECYSSGTATFLLMGTTCTRACSFCSVNHGPPLPLDTDEPEKIALAAKSLSLRHIVITSVTRDDLSDGGAAHFARTVAMCRTHCPSSSVELLVPDFNGNLEALETVIAARPDVLDHNVETVPRLYPTVRPRAEYKRSLAILAHGNIKNSVTKSGFMVGLGESEVEIADLLCDLAVTGCKIVTIGQYLQPTARQLPVARYIPPEQFARYEQKAKSLGFTHVFSGPFVRSSYRAQEVRI